MSVLDKQITRRQFMLGSVAAGSGAVALWGSWPWLPGFFHREGVYAFPKRTEVWKGVNTVFSVCRQCRSDCGLVARVYNGVLTKLDGNPYHANATEPHLNYSAPVEDAIKFQHAHSLCARGQAGVQTLYDRDRIYFPLKRAGARGSDKWKTISWEQLISEVVDGGRLFKDVPGEETRNVEGFKALWKGGKGPNIPVDSKHPDMGPITNQFTLFWGRAEPGQSDMLARFTKSFGSVNAIPHVGICELSHHVATAQSFNGHMHMVKPDFMNAHYVMLFGVSLYQANFPAQTYWRKVAHAYAEGPMQKLVVVDVACPNGVKVAGEYVKVIPGSDGALAMGMIRRIMEADHYNTSYLQHPSHESAVKNGESNHSNATWLVVDDPKHPLYRQFLTTEAAGLGKIAAGAVPEQGVGAGNYRKYLTTETALLGKPDSAYHVGATNYAAVVIDATTGKPAAASRADRGNLWPSGPLALKAVIVNGIACRTSFQKLWQEAQAKTIAEYAQAAGIPEATISRLGDEFSSHGRKAVTDFYRGAVKHSNGYYNGRAVMMLNFLVGNVDYVGGTIIGGPAADHMGKSQGAPYKLSQWPGPKRSVSPGVALSREGSFYEDTSLYKDAVAQGKSPFPAPRPWFPLGFGIWHELFAGIWTQYPYPAKIVLQHMANPVYTAPPGMSGSPDESLPVPRMLKDLNKVPLYIVDDILISETSRYADYIVPDTSYLEMWGMLPGFPTYPTGLIGVRQPVVEPLTAKTPSGEPMSVEQFLIDVAKKLGMPGFGKNAFMEGGDLDTREDYFLKMVANIASYPGMLTRKGDQLVDSGPVPDASAPLELKAIERWKPRYGRAITDAQWRKVGYVLARGGRMEDYDTGYQPAKPVPKFAAHRYGGTKLPCQIYNPVVAVTHNAISGELFSGTCKYEEIRFQNGTLVASVDKPQEYPFILVTHKQPIHSHSRTIADPWLVEMLPESYLDINPMDARRLGLKDGDWIRMRSASYSKGITGPIRIMPGVRPGVLNFPHSFGHWHHNSGSWTINGTTYSGNPYKNSPCRFNPVMRLDPSLTGQDGWGTCITDSIGGSSSYYDTRVKIEKIATPSNRDRYVEPIPAGTVVKDLYPA